MLGTVGWAYASAAFGWQAGKRLGANTKHLAKPAGTCNASEGNLGHGTARVEAASKVEARAGAKRLSGESSFPFLSQTSFAKPFALLVLLTALTFFATGTGFASAQDRTLSLYNTHTHERLTVTYKRNGRFVQAGLNQLNRFLRDWRRDEVTRIDPDLFDIVWTVYREVGASEPIHVVSAYRSPATNNMLRRRSSGVARNSQHTQGRAMDFFIPGVSAAEIRAAGLRLQQGGVGFYPRSATPFVHLDTGSVRMWPRMTRSQLSRVFPNGRTIHIPADGQPMPGFEQAQRDLQRGGGRTVFASASASSDQNDGDGDIVLPGESGGGFLQALFGGNTPEPEAEVPSAPSRTVVASLPEQPAAAETEVASAPRDRYAAPSPVLPPYASPDGTWAAPSTVAGLTVPSPTPAPTIDDIQLAALGTRPAPAAPGAVALDNAFALAQSAPATTPLAPPVTAEPALAAATSAAQPATQTPAALPAINRAQQIAQSVPAPGQIAAIIEARFAEQRAAQASLTGQVAQALGAVPARPTTAAQPATAAATPDPNESLLAFAQPTQSPLTPGNVLSETGQLAAAAQAAEPVAPRFIPPVPAPSPTLVAAAPTPTPSSAQDNALIAAAFAAEDAARTPAQSAIDILTGSTDMPAGTGITGRLYPIADDLTPALAKQSIRGAQHAALVAPTGTVSLSPSLVRSNGFVPSNTFQLRTDGFGRSGS
ncbi:MAG: DUF882 domain-containing protein [Rhizobiales bacterium]|nr:DUF882 domain-containing protein [Hyphomicrobiales bacterium]MBO6700192.1 DUF882 domain-containing protein [Hyphomicrobiales bacterium]MBO6737643.1 DUF882 domain-containing protein [Hyphomicrobiales bacterium]MBO6913300.1 DUF882 domain-containing protein [Hyphomicrobiales bacterium]MBO6956858.1 DUF882 domain-containing protein [Hyphomicrobiales bacterium]